MLVPLIYQRVHFANVGKRLGTRRQSFLELAPIYAHHCQTLAIHIPSKGPLHELFRDGLHHFSNLETLEIHFQPNSTEPEPTDGGTEPLGFSRESELSLTEYRLWKTFCHSLPQHVFALRLSGIPWPDFAKGIAGVTLPHVRILDLNLTSGGRVFSSKSAGPFSQMFSGIVDLTLEAHWPFTEAWVRGAFARLRLQRLTLRGHPEFRDPDADDWELLHSDYLTAYRLHHQWGPAITVLLEQNDVSLTYLSIGSSLCLNIAVDGATEFPVLSTLKFPDVDFKSDSKRFLQLMMPFAQCESIHTLHLDNCFGIPKVFSNLFDPKRSLWLALKRLSMINAKTYYGRGDDLYDQLEASTREDMETPMEGEGYWNSRPRLALEKHCEARNIEFAYEWDFFEFC